MNILFTLTEDGSFGEEIDSSIRDTENYVIRQLNFSHISCFFCFSFKEIQIFKHLRRILYHSIFSNFFPIVVKTRLNCFDPNFVVVGHLLSRHRYAKVLACPNFGRTDYSCPGFTGLSSLTRVSNSATLDQTKLKEGLHNGIS